MLSWALTFFVVAIIAAVLGFTSVDSVRAGKYMEIRIDAPDRDEAEAQVTEMCRKLLANPVIEDFRFEVEDMPIGA